jgi:hypothetical protein
MGVSVASFSARSTGMINESKAVAFARRIAERENGRDYVEKQAEFYAVTNEIAKRNGCKIPGGVDRRIKQILATRGVANNEKLKDELWKLQNICMDCSQISEAERRRFKEGIAKAKSHEEKVREDENWMRWYVGKVGSSHVSGKVDGSEYFGFFAGKLKENNQRYVKEPWFWTYLSYVVNETSLEHVFGSNRGGDKAAPVSTIRRAWKK